MYSSFVSSIIIQKEGAIDFDFLGACLGHGTCGGIFSTKLRQ